MKSCNRDLLSAYLDGGLLLPQRVGLEQHLKSCGTCSRELDALRRVDDLLATWGSRRKPISVQAEQRISASVSRRRRLRPLFALSRMVPAAVGSSIAAVLVVFSINFGLLFGNAAVSTTPAAAGRTTAKIIVSQSRPLVNARRTSAVFGSHVDTISGASQASRNRSVAV